MSVQCIDYLKINTYISENNADYTWRSVTGLADKDNSCGFITVERRSFPEQNVKCLIFLI